MLDDRTITNVVDVSVTYLSRAMRRAGQTDRKSDFRYEFTGHNRESRAWDRGIGKTRAKILHGVARPGFNLFCGGHTFLADGLLFAVGVHILDSVGEKRAAIYDPEANTLTEAAPTNKGRWYPTLITLADGGVLVISGSFTGGAGGVNTNQQVWKDGFWRSSGDHLTIPLYPRMHLAPDGRMAHYRFEPKR